jgi:hypothetical protein
LCHERTTGHPLPAIATPRVGLAGPGCRLRDVYAAAAKREWPLYAARTYIRRSLDPKGTPMLDLLYIALAAGFFVAAAASLPFFERL